MATSKVTPNGLAATLTRSLGRPVTAKMVRTLARTILATHDKVKHPEYQGHEYGADEVRRLTVAMRARGSRTPSAASVKVKARTPRKVKVAPVAPVVS